MSLRPETFVFFQKLLADRSGLSLQREKAYLLESRLARVLRERDCATLDDLAARLRDGADAGLERDVVEAMMTHETLFFRDLKSFETLRDVILPGLIAARAKEKRLAIWSAACSAGQEPYSVAMLLDDMASTLGGWSVRILATDLSGAVIERAKKAVYTQFEVQRGLGVRHLLKHFTQEPDGWRLEPRIRDAVDFRTFNLLRDPSAFGRFDLILCRNVMIYFDAPTRAGLFSRLRRQIAPDGALMLGAAESAIGATTEFAQLRDAPNFCRPSPAAARERVAAGA